MADARVDRSIGAPAAGISRRAVLKGGAAGAAASLVPSGWRSAGLAAGMWPAPAEEDRMKTVRTDDGITISYKTQGPGPRAVLFMHGWGGALTYWDDFLTHVDLTGLRAISASYRGHGESDKPTTGYTIDRFAKDMFAVADQEGADELVLVGFSMAGKFAQYMAYLRPEQVRGQVLVAPAPAAEMPLPREVGQEWLEAAPDRARFRELLAPFIKVPPKPELIDLYCDNVARTPRVALEGTLEMFAYTSIVEEARTVAAPTLVVGGAADPMLPPDYLREQVLGVIGGARLALLDCGHETPIELPQETAGLIEALVAGLA
jgi:pimeloyl-ACP methyl ester carboxylesterase